ncbi:hypothetical protein ACIQNU_04130 [Streptomyces sp. NPDC091292]|uniref:hypothetical protein n=1 Tax=Streptomyces sp. NPDC091292 TaxID=3365991 RepID=UPI00381CFCAE
MTDPELQRQLAAVISALAASETENQTLRHALRDILGRFEPAWPSPNDPMRYRATVPEADYDRWNATLNPTKEN